MSNLKKDGQLEYWKKRIHTTIDGSRVPAEDSMEFFIKRMNIKKSDVVLDLGCSFGRMYRPLSRYTKTIFGIDVNSETINAARQYPYTNLSTGIAEQTGMPDAFFDAIIAWAVYDVVEQEDALIEENRILKQGGIFLITGKNSNYSKNDETAFIAERNAKVNDYPNHFTDVYSLIENSHIFGFKVVEAYGFPRRGDWANMNYVNLLTQPNQDFYEFLIIFEKVGIPARRIKICHEYSDTAKNMAQENDFDDVRLFLNWHKKQFND